MRSVEDLKGRSERTIPRDKSDDIWSRFLRILLVKQKRKKIWNRKSPYCRSVGMNSIFLLTVDVHDVILGHVTFVTIWTIEDQLEAAVAFT